MNLERCVVLLYKKYVIKCSNDVIGGIVFYLTPKRKWSTGDEIRFSRSSIGKNCLRSAVANMCKKANFEGCYTNHSLRVTTCILALAKGIPEKLVMERTGHRNVKSLHEYQRVISKEREAMSDVLQLPRKSLWRRIRVSLCVRKLFSIVAAWILHLVPRLHLLTVKLYLT